MIAHLGDVSCFIENIYDEAAKAADGIFEFSEGIVKNARVKAHLATFPTYSNLQVGGGKEIWAAVLYTDLRNSSNRAIEIGPRATYISMHCLLGGLAYLVQKAGGCVSNFRGDGLFGLFGLDDSGANPADLNESRMVKKATTCGIAMIEMIDEVINPLLAQNGIRGDLRIGVGVDHGRIVVTKIGLAHANEITPYGPPVNHAAKFCGGNCEIYVSRRAHDIYPESKGGKLTFEHASIPVKGGKALAGYKVKYPRTLQMLGRNPDLQRTPPRRLIG
jgi:class 3 adenylate cyclase